jgi:hypothetical protein
MTTKSVPFLVTGLPRSRTAWMSVLTTTAHSLCLHEPSAAFKDIEELRGFYDCDYPNFIGASDSGLGFFLPWILENIRPHTLIIERDPQEVTESLCQLGLPRTNYAYLLQEAIEPFRHHPLCLWVRFDRLDDRRTIEKVFWHLMPGVPFDEERWAQLARMHIQVDLRKALQHYSLHRSAADCFMRDVIRRVRPLEDQHANA